MAIFSTACCFGLISITWIIFRQKHKCGEEIFGKWHNQNAGTKSFLYSPYSRALRFCPPQPPKIRRSQQHGLDKVRPMTTLSELICRKDIAKPLKLQMASPKTKINMNRVSKKHSLFELLFCKTGFEGTSRSKYFSAPSPNFGQKCPPKST